MQSKEWQAPRKGKKIPWLDGHKEQDSVVLSPYYGLVVVEVGSVWTRARAINKCYTNKTAQYAEPIDD